MKFSQFPPVSQKDEFEEWIGTLMPYAAVSLAPNRVGICRRQLQQAVQKTFLAVDQCVLGTSRVSRDAAVYERCHAIGFFESLESLPHAHLAMFIPSQRTDTYLTGRFRDEASIVDINSGVTGVIDNAKRALLRDRQFRVLLNQVHTELNQVEARDLRFLSDYTACKPLTHSSHWAAQWEAQADQFRRRPSAVVKSITDPKGWGRYMSKRVDRAYDSSDLFFLHDMFPERQSVDCRRGRFKDRNTHQSGFRPIYPEEPA